MEACDVVLEKFEPLLSPDSTINEQTTEIPYFSADLIEELVTQSIKVLSAQPTLLHIPSPCTIVGDIHGNIHDLLKILKRFPTFRSTDKILFLGDYVDRGNHSVEVVMLLLALVCKYPDNVFLLRGNHEFSQVNIVYGFYEEVFMTYQCVEVWETFHKAFAWLPFAAVVGEKIFCVHGGLSPKVATLEQIAAIQRPVYVYENGSVISDLVWSDPHENVTLFGQSNRGSGVLFGVQAIKNFLRNVNLKLIVRAHQCFVNGYCTFGDNTGVSVFSSSEYCKIAHNKCGVMRVDDKEKVEVFAFDDSNFDVARPVMSMVFGKGLGLKKEVTKILMPRPLKRNVCTANSNQKQKMLSARGRAALKSARGTHFRLPLDAFAY